MADQRGILTKARLQEVLETSLTTKEMEQLFALVKVKDSGRGGIDYTGLVATLFER